MNPNSDIERLQPIPSPPGHLLREFCHRVLPVLVFAGAGLGAAYLWNQRFTGTLLQGEVEPIRANVTTFDDGTVASLHVQRWQAVTNGQPIATLEIMDADAVGRSVDVLRSELQILRSRMALDESRNEQNLEGLRVRWLESRVALATSRVALENARRDLDRSEKLRNERIISQADYDNAEAVFDALKVEVSERSSLAEGLQKSLDRLDAGVAQERGGSLRGLEQSLSAREAVLEHSGLQVLRAPMAGIVRSLDVSRGERIPAGTVVAVVTAPTAERIVGFVRQPLALEPAPGMSVEIRTRGTTRQICRSQITDVGVDLEMVDSILRLRGLANSVERGLAFGLPIPPELKVRPGELVDLIVRHSTE